MTYTCQICGKTRTETIPYLNDPMPISTALPENKTIAKTDNMTPSEVNPTEIIVDNNTTFSIKNNSKVKKTAKIKIKDKDSIKSIIINGKKIKVKSGKESITLKLKKYKKFLKKKGKWNKLVVIDKLGNKNTIKFKIK